MSNIVFPTFLPLQIVSNILPRLYRNCPNDEKDQKKHRVATKDS